MKRRDSLKVSQSSGIASALPMGVMSLNSCSDNKSSNKAEVGAPDISGSADLLVLGNIITVDNSQLFADAMTIKNGYIQYVGTKDNALKYCNENTQTMDYGKLSVYPGFMEAHCHGSAAGQLEATAKLYHCESYEEYQDVIRKYINDNPGKESYNISGWRNIDGVLPTAKLLDEVSTTVKILGGSLDGHCILMNTKAMKDMNIYNKEYGQGKYTDAELPRDAEGCPLGYFAEAAAMDIMKIVPVALENAKDSILHWQEFAFKKGIVAAGEAGVNLVSETYSQAYAELAKEKKLKIRTRGFWKVEKEDANADMVKKIKQMSLDLNDEYYKIVGVKIFMDGVIESHTALLTEKYEDADTYGLDRFKDEEGDPDATLKALVLEAHKQGLPTHTHTIGDGAIKKILDAIEYAKNTTGNNEIRDMLAHIEIIRPEDIKRFAKLNVSAIVAALWGPRNSLTPWPEQLTLIGERRAAGDYYQVMNSFVKMGVNCAQHSDYPVSQAFDVPRTIYCGITRQTPEGGPESERLPQEAVTRLEILQEMTVNVAKLWNEENHMGTLTRGKVANFVVYDVDFIDDDVQKIPDAKLMNVFVDGIEVYKA